MTVIFTFYLVKNPIKSSHKLTIYNRNHMVNRQCSTKMTRRIQRLPSCRWGVDSRQKATNERAALLYSAVFPPGFSRRQVLAYDCSLDFRRRFSI